MKGTVKHKIAGSNRPEQIIATFTPQLNVNTDTMVTNLPTPQSVAYDEGGLLLVELPSTDTEPSNWTWVVEWSHGIDLTPAFNLHDGETLDLSTVILANHDTATGEVFTDKINDFIERVTIVTADMRDAIAATAQSELNASQSARGAETSARRAEHAAANVIDAQAQAQAAQKSATAAATSAKDAAASATTAAQSTNAAILSADTAASHASLALTYRNSATTHADNAAASATAAAASATTASSHATAAASSKSSAATSATNAANSRSAAATSATNAANSKSAAATSATNAAASAATAQQIVNNIADTGWITVPLKAGMSGDLAYRVRDGICYWRGNITKTDGTGFTSALTTVASAIPANALPNVGGYFTIHGRDPITYMVMDIYTNGIMRVRGLDSMLPKTACINGVTYPSLTV